MPDPLRVNESGPKDESVIDTTGQGNNEAAAGQKPAPAHQIPVPLPPVSLARRLWPLVALLFCAAVVMLVWLNLDRILDWQRLRGYTAPDNIKQLSRDATFTPLAERLFYVNRPAVEDKDTFNQNCPDASEQVAVLGCYAGDRRGIHIYDVTDDRLYGIEQVTAAHEMLHQAYDRLDSRERKRVNDLLTQYATTVTDRNLLGKLNDYQSLESGEVLNEQHSLFGTEVENLPAELETYYRQYFTNRSQLVAYHQQQESAFTERQEQIQKYDEQLKSLREQIDAERGKISTVETQLKGQRSQMDAWLKAGQVDQYNATVPAFNAAVTAYTTQLELFNTLVNQHNDILEKRGKIALQEQELQKALDSQASSVKTK